MDRRLNFFFLVVVLGFVAIDGIEGYAIVTGIVYCDQCKDGLVSLLDYPFSGVNIAVQCVDDGGNLEVVGEETTNSLGAYFLRFPGTPDLSSCHAQVVPSNNQGPDSCGAVAGPSQILTLSFRVFSMDMYIVDNLISQPSQPMPFCLGAGSPPLVPVTPPPQIIPPPPHHVVPYLEGSVCPYWKWTMQEYECHWKLYPHAKVALVFGLTAAGTYGTDITLWQALHGKADPYKTLLREATSALLNSFNSIYFKYHPLAVIAEFNFALLGSERHVMRTALKFKRANSGDGVITCKLTPCEK